MKVFEFIWFLEDDDRVIIRKNTEDIIFGTLTSSVLDKRKKDIDLEKCEDVMYKTIEYVDYTRWGHVCNITLEDESDDD